MHKHFLLILIFSCHTFLSGMILEHEMAKPTSTKIKQILNVATLRGDREKIQNVLDKGYDINSLNFRYEAAWLGVVESLHVANISTYEILKIVLPHVKDTNATFCDGNTVLMKAAALDRTDICTVLLAHKANINMQNREGSTALMIATQEGCIETVKLLLENNADTSLRNVDKKTALTIARTRLRSQNNKNRSLQRTGTAQARQLCEVLLKHNQAQSKPGQNNQGESDCSICFESASKSNFVALSCGHEFCWECQRDQLQTVVETLRNNSNIKSAGVKSLLKCMHRGCEHIISAKDIVLIAKLKCGDQSSEELRHIMDQDFCFDCRDIHNSGLACPNASRAALHNSNNELEDPWLKANIKACPSCQHKRMLDGGCNKVTCEIRDGGCGLQWCWIHVEPWSDKHKFCKFTTVEALMGGVAENLRAVNLRNVVNYIHPLNNHGYYIALSIMFTYILRV